ncbi:hypothetical protein CANARDRAFT_26542 [[Candida] arabinofermentans NRRL YB-2248]|uniref:Uncharacterized protein n=1 Tax=[Candida] arabinofermentans NRRL YB-2248 TaxID=983967 RepID=A0A1E4T5S6_9ASCO|nr:hypothetical protein CANARDRAFT_26542 [[Candida] arabinofermentans NRRL YB-2248]
MASVAIISGGTAANSLLEVFSRLSQDSKSGSGYGGNIKFTSHILPVSDNGGSTSEIIRVLGGCSVGDIRSRITRLIPDESAPLRELLSLRLSKDPIKAKIEWGEIVEGSHFLWKKVDPPVKEIVRSFLIHVHMELLKRSRNSTKNFRLELASVGNLFITGARLFCGSLDSAVELILRISRVDSGIKVLPCLNTNFTYHISALLKDGTIITGQSQISHPSAKPQQRKGQQLQRQQQQQQQHQNQQEEISDLMVRSDSIAHPPPIIASASTSPTRENRNTDRSMGDIRTITNISTTSFSEAGVSGSRHGKIDSQDVIYGTTDINHSATNEQIDDLFSGSDSEHGSDGENEYAVPSYTHPALKISQLHFNKDDNVPLPAPIDRIFYISPYGEEIYPLAQTRVLNCLTASNIIVYSIGSLMTSIVPVLILQGVGEAIMTTNEQDKKKPKLKVLLLNGSLDRETESLDALGYIKTIYDSLMYSMVVGNGKLKDKETDLNSMKPNLSSFVTHLFHLEPSENIDVNVKEIESFGISCIGVKAMDGCCDRYDPDDLFEKFNTICSMYNN